jgi:hypothetical protein
MEDVLDLYEEPYDSNEPLICFDELPYQMVAETRMPLPVGSLDTHSATTTSTSARARPTCLCSSSPREAFGAWR